MKSLLLDTNIYGELVIDLNLDFIKRRIEQQTTLVIFGSPIVRRELRATPRKIRVGGRNLRIDLLSLYDLLTRNRILLPVKEIENLADSYYEAYQKLGGGKGKKELVHDYLLVASAAWKNMDLVVSDDEATMKSEYSLQAYSLVNGVKKIRNPLFLNYAEFKKLLR